MKKTCLFLLLLLCPLILKAETLVLVSVAPQKYLIEKIAKRTVTVEVIVPPGASPHSYEPTPHQIVKIKRGEVWFRIGEGFEKPLLSLLKNSEIVDQREGIDLIPSGCKFCCADACDSHIWLSPKNLKIMAQQIYDVLSKKNPQFSPVYKENLDALLKELDVLDMYIREKFKDVQQRTILVSHPAFGYFARDYGLIQVSIEMEGKEPTAKYLANLFQLARKENIKYVFLQKQYNYKAGKRIAEELNAKVIFLDPYEENVIYNLKTIAQAFSQ